MISGHFSSGYACIIGASPDGIGILDELGLAKREMPLPQCTIAASLLQRLICLSISNTSASTVTAKSRHIVSRSVLYPYCCPITVNTS